MLRVEWIKVHRFRDVVAGTYLTFHDGFSIALGKNGTGKTTLMELIGAVSRLDPGFLDREKEDVHVEFALRWEESHGRRLNLVGVMQSQSGETRASGLQPDARTRYRSTSIHVDATSPATNQIAETRFDDGVLRIRAGGGIQTFRPLQPYLTFVVVGIAAASFFPTAKAAQGTVRFDESLGFLNDLADFQVLVVDVVKGNPPQRASVFRGTEVPPGLLASTVAKAAVSLEISLKSDATIARAISLFHAQDAVLSTVLQSESEQGDDSMRFGERMFGVPSLRVDFAHRRMAFADLSYGQRRLLALFWYLSVHPDIAIIDEPVNGLHHAWIQALLAELRNNRQVFLTSQNPLLLDELTFADAEEVRRTFIVCTTEERDGKNVMVWKNMDVETSQRFFEAYEIGAQHVGELLRVHGLW